MWTMILEAYYRDHAAQWTPAAVRFALSCVRFLRQVGRAMTEIDAMSSELADAAREVLSQADLVGELGARMQNPAPPTLSDQICAAYLAFVAELLVNQELELNKTLSQHQDAAALVDAIRTLAVGLPVRAALVELDKRWTEPGTHEANDSAHLLFIKACAMRGQHASEGTYDYVLGCLKSSGGFWPAFLAGVCFKTQSVVKRLPLERMSLEAETCLSMLDNFHFVE
jgi:hypothetical protein